VDQFRVQIMRQSESDIAANQQAAHRRWPAAVRVANLGAHTFHRDIGLVYCYQASLSAPVRMLVELMVEHVKTINISGFSHTKR
jgi:hypothetical protein